MIQNSLTGPLRLEIKLAETSTLIPQAERPGWGSCHPAHLQSGALLLACRKALPALEEQLRSCPNMKTIIVTQSEGKKTHLFSS